jgi:arylsulfatase A-like enzyme/Flp pilus assembly protein TadD
MGFRTVLALGSALLLAACGGGGEERAPSDGARDGTGLDGAARSALLITLDTTRADHLEPYGAPAGSSPALAALAADGVVFERAFAVSPLTLPTHASLLTGLYPPRHGLRNNGSHALPESVPTLATIARDAGLRTAAVLSSAVLDRRYGLHRGFERYDDDLSEGRVEARMVVERTASAAVDSALAWLDTVAPGERFFLWVHLFDPHASYRPPAPFDRRFAEDPYAGEIAYMDSEIGRLLAHPRLADAGGVAVAAVADHGESLGEHGEMTHGLLLYEGTQHVPWLLRIPGGPRGLRWPGAVSQVDVAPTLLGLLGLDPPADDDGTGTGFAGLDLLPHLAGLAEPPAPRSLYAESLLPLISYGWSDLALLRRDGWKLIRAPAPELYHLEDDPGERDNRFDERRDLGRDLARRLERLLAEVGEAEAAEPRALDDETAAQLRSLGYIAAAGTADRGTADRDDRPRPDPKRMIDVHHTVQQAEGLMEEGRYGVAEELLRGILERDPENTQVLYDLAQVLIRQERSGEAAELLERALETAPESALLNTVLGQLEAGRGNLERAATLAGVAAAADRRNLEPQLLEAEYLARLGRVGEAERIWRRLTGDFPEAAEPWSHLAGLHLKRGDWPAARDAARRAVELAPSDAAAWNSLGYALDELGRPEEAAAAYGKALEADPGHWQARFNLGLLLRRTDPRAAAEAFATLLRQRPDHTPAHCELGILQAGPLGDPAAARDHLRLCLEGDPDNPKADLLRQALAQIDAALAGGG